MFDFRGLVLGLSLLGVMAVSARAADKDKVVMNCTVPQLSAYAEAVRLTVLSDLLAKGYSAEMSSVTVTPRVVRRSRSARFSSKEILGQSAIAGDPQLIYTVTTPSLQAFSVPLGACQATVDLRIQVNAVKQDEDTDVRTQTRRRSRVKLGGIWVLNSK